MVFAILDMNPPWVYMCSPSWTPLPPPSPSSGSSQCTSPEHPVSCIEPGLAIWFTYDNIHVSMLFFQIIPPSPSPTESKRLFCISVSLLWSCIQGYHYHLSKFHIYALVYCIGVFYTKVALRFPREFLAKSQKYLSVISKCEANLLNILNYMWNIIKLEMMLNLSLYIYGFMLLL